jgi:23S rRNA maturation mini-RNase III
MGFHTLQQQAEQVRQKEASIVKRLRNETLHTTEKLLSALPTNRQFLSRLN